METKEIITKDKKEILFFLCSLCVVSAVVILFGKIHFISGAACSDHYFSGYAWSENAGWISFSCRNNSGAEDYGVDKDAAGLLSGYAWSENIGWISFNQTDLAGCPSGVCEARVSPSTYAFSGWARALSAPSSASGWGGWIKLSGTADDATPYGAVLNTSTKEVNGWAWGGDESEADSTGVIGWISFNCENNGSCGSVDYSVTAGAASFPPVISSLTPPADDSNNYCKCWLDASDVKQDGRFGQVQFSWIYGDPGGFPMEKYELKISTINDISGATTTYLSAVGLDVSPGLQYDTLPFAGVSVQPGSNEMAYGQTYYWWAKACNSGGACSDWTAGPSFSTPVKHYPIVGITWANQRVEINQDIQFCTTADINDQDDPCYSACYKGAAFPAIPDNPTDSGSDWVCSACFEAGESDYHSCRDVAGTQYGWLFPGLAEGSDYVFLDDTSATSSNPIVRFSTIGKSQTVKLRVSGSSCGEEAETDILLPNPVWKEVTPF